MAEIGSRGAVTLIEEIEVRIAELEVSIKEKELWETSEVVRKDTKMEEGTFEAAVSLRHGGEVVKIGRVVGRGRARAT